MNYKKRNNKDYKIGNDDKEIIAIIKLLMSYKISIFDLEILIKEINTAVNHSEQIHNKFDNEIKLLELDKDKSLSKIREKIEQEILCALENTKIPYQNYCSYDTYTNMIFNKDKLKELKEISNRATWKYEGLKRDRNRIYERESHEIVHIFDKKLSDLKKQRANVKWWESSSYKLLKHTIIKRGNNIALGSKLPIDKPELIFQAIDIYKSELEKKEQLDTLKAKAAAADKKSRKLGSSIRRKIANQIKISTVCPYCGELLNIDTAHADHIYPLSKGGLSTIKNMVYVCDRCNMQKKDFTLNKFIKMTGYNRVEIERMLDLLKKDY